MRTLRLATCVGVTAVLARAVIAQPAGDAGVPESPLDAGVPVDGPPTPDAAPHVEPAKLPPLPPPLDMSRQFAHEKPYPIELVDRPLVLPSRATYLDPSVLVRTYIKTAVDGTGIETRERTVDGGLYLSVGHVFGPVEVSLDLETAAQLRFNMLIPGQPLRVGLSASTLLPQRDHRYVEDQTASATYKAVVIPHRLALLAGASATLAEARVHDDAGMNVEGVYVHAGASGTAEYQLARRLCLSAGLSGGGYVYKSAPFDLSAWSEAHVAITVLLRRWDFYASSYVGLRTPLQSATFIGFEKRWGI